MLYSHSNGLRESERAIGYCLIVQKQENEKIHIFTDHVPQVTCVKEVCQKQAINQEVCLSDWNKLCFILVME
jgi:hypothetical protein